jgi:hypothetical protein
VPDELPTSLEVLREVGLHESLELFIVLQIYRVPKLRLAVMQIIDAVKIQIFFMPPKHGFPTANIYIRIRYSRYFLVSQSTATHILIFECFILTSTKFEPQIGSKEFLCQKGYQKHQLHIPENCFGVISRTK